MQPAMLGARGCCAAALPLFATLVLSVCAFAQNGIETPQQTNDRIKSLSSTAHMRPHDYVIGNGDLLDIEVFDVKELSRTVRVSQTGSIGIPLVPVRLHVAGLTELQAEQKISEVLETNGLVVHPQVSISVKERKSKPITVVGAVGHSMVYQADRPVTLLEVLAEAGGIANDAGDLVLVTRPVPLQPPFEQSVDASPGMPTDSSAARGETDSVPSTQSTSASPLPATSSEIPKTVFAGPTDRVTAPPSAADPPPLSNTITVNLNELVENGDATHNIVLFAGDIVTVPHAGIVYVLGAVGRPGGFVLANDRSQMSALKVLALAGGLSRTARSDHAVIVRKNNQGQQHEVIVDLKKVLNRQTEDLPLQPSDILYVPDSAAKHAAWRAAELALSIGTGVALYRVAYR